MKIRYLKKLIGDSGYIIHNCDEVLAVASSMISQLITLDPKTLKLKHSLDTFNKGRDSLKHKELELLWDNLQKVIDSGEIKNILDGDDTVENPITVYHIKDGLLCETKTEKYGWPNITKEGYLIYNNTFFLDKKAAIKHGIEEHEARVEWINKRISELTEEIKKKKEDLHTNNSIIDYLKSLQE